MRIIFIMQDQIGYELSPNVAKLVLPTDLIHFI